MNPHVLWLVGWLPNKAGKILFPSPFGALDYSSDKVVAKVIEIQYLFCPHTIGFTNKSKKKKNLSSFFVSEKKFLSCFSSPFLAHALDKLDPYPPPPLKLSMFLDGSRLTCVCQNTTTNYPQSEFAY